MTDKYIIERYEVSAEDCISLCPRDKILLTAPEGDHIVVWILGYLESDKR